MSNTARTNTKTSTKFYDNMNVNGWDLKFEYETENGKLTQKVVVNGNKGNSSVYISKVDSQVQTIFSNGEYDAEVITAVMAEVSAIVSEHTPVPVEE